MNVLASAPGKLVLVGEYAVLTGAPALVIAANRRALVRLGPQTGATSTVRTNGGASSTARYRFDGAHAPKREGSALPLVDAVLGELAAELGLAETPPFAACLDTASFVEREGTDASHKLGLGSSAALTVAFASALAEYTGRLNGQSNRWLGRLISVHRRFQGGRGSGLDVAASLLGGVISYRLNEAEEDPAVVARSLPRSFHLLAVWSGRPASTEAALGRLERWRAGQPAAHARAIGELEALARGADDAAREGDANGLIAAVAGYGPALDRLGAASGIEIYSAEHRRIAALARAHGAAYKPCGAGGGDVGLACSNDQAALAALRESLEEGGFRALDLAVDPVGLQVQPSPE